MVGPGETGWASGWLKYAPAAPFLSEGWMACWTWCRKVVLPTYLYQGNVNVTYYSSEAIEARGGDHDRGRADKQSAIEEAMSMISSLADWLFLLTADNCVLINTCHSTCRPAAVSLTHSVITYSPSLPTTRSLE